MVTSSNDKIEIGAFAITIIATDPKMSQRDFLNLHSETMGLLARYPNEEWDRIMVSVETRHEGRDEFMRKLGYKPNGARHYIRFIERDAARF